MKVRLDGCHSHSGDLRFVQWYENMNKCNKFVGKSDQTLGCIRLRLHRDTDKERKIDMSKHML